MLLRQYTYSADPQYGGGKADQYITFLQQQIIPLALKTYRFAKDPTLGILGSSLGGLLSCYAGWVTGASPAAHRFTKIGCMSPSFWWNGQDFNTTVLTNSRTTVPKGSIFYLDSGDTDGDSDIDPDTVTVREHMEAIGFTLNKDLFYYLDRGGEHSEVYWGRRFHIPMQVLYGVPSDRVPSAP
jgi:predicted alpha/beta superfamily hydrolase